MRTTLTLFGLFLLLVSCSRHDQTNALLRDAEIPQNRLETGSSGFHGSKDDRTVTGESNLLALTFRSTNGIIPIMPQDLMFTSNEVQELEYAAEKNDGLSSAIKLAGYYSLVDYNVEKWIKYLKIAAAHGHIASQYNLGFVFSTIPQVKDLDAAKKWYETAAKSGDSDAKEKLKTFAEAAKASK